MDQRDKAMHKMREMQHQVRKNALDTQNYLAGLAEWETDIRKKDADLLAQNNVTDPAAKYPIRLTPLTSGNSSSKTTTKKCLKNKKSAESSTIKSSDYRGWDKFDAVSDRLIFRSIVRLIDWLSIVGIG